MLKIDRFWIGSGIQMTFGVLWFWLWFWPCNFLLFGWFLVEIWVWWMRNMRTLFSGWHSSSLALELWALAWTSCFLEAKCILFLFLYSLGIFVIFQWVFLASDLHHGLLHVPNRHRFLPDRFKPRDIQPGTYPGLDRRPRLSLVPQRYIFPLFSLFPFKMMSSLFQVFGKNGASGEKVFGAIPLGSFAFGSFVVSHCFLRERLKEKIRFWFWLHDALRII